MTVDIFSDDGVPLPKKVKLSTPKAVEAFSEEIIQLTINGEISPTQGKALAEMLARHRVIQAAVSVTGRLEAVEAQLKLKQGGTLTERVNGIERASNVTSEVADEDLETFEERMRKFRERFPGYADDVDEILGGDYGNTEDTTANA